MPFIPTILRKPLSRAGQINSQPYSQLSSRAVRPKRVSVLVDRPGDKSVSTGYAPPTSSLSDESSLGGKTLKPSPLSPAECRKWARKEGRRPPRYKVTRNSGALFTAWIIDERGVKYERRRAVINAGAELLVRTLLIARAASDARETPARSLLPARGSDKWPRHRWHRACYVTYVTYPVCQRNHSSELFHANSPAFRDPRRRSCPSFSLCRHFRKTICIHMRELLDSETVESSTLPGFQHYRYKTLMMIRYSNMQHWEIIPALLYLIITDLFQYTGC